LRPCGLGADLTWLWHATNILVVLQTDKTGSGTDLHRDSACATDGGGLVVAVLGVGTMGAYIAADFALAGHDVRFTTSNRTSPTAAVQRVRDAAGQPCSGRLSHAPSTDVAAAGATLIIESLPEDLEIKTRALREAQAVAPRALLGTNTSSLTVTSIAAGLEDPTRLVGTHYVNPPWAFRLVEVVAGAWSDPAVLAEVEEILTKQDRVPIRVNQDLPGFVFNRLQFALLREALHLVEQGVLAAADVDRVVVEGLGRRLALTGPLATAGLGGTDLFIQLAQRLYPELCQATTPPDDMRRLLPDDRELQEARQARQLGLAEGADVPKMWRARPGVSA
jgi:3-hydroxybutyryl-CoA dehydrogenase